MKRIYILTLAALTASAAVAASPAVSKHKANPGKKSVNVEKKFNGDRLKARQQRRAETGPIWKPVTQMVALWEGEWFDVEKYTTEYDKEGLILSDIVQDAEDPAAQATRTTNKYDGFGMKTLATVEKGFVGGEWTPYSRTAISYDPIVHDLIIDNEECLWRNNEWQAIGNVYKRVVTRNNAGNVTSVEVLVPYEGKEEAIQRLVVTYGEDGKASTIETSVLTTGKNGGFVWQTEMKYENIIWEETDGQIVDDDITFGNNRAKSFTVWDIDGENNVEVTYPDDKGSFRSMLTYADGNLVTELNVLDDNGSSEYKSVETYTDGTETLSYEMIERYVYDNAGLQTEYYYADGYTGDLEIIAWEKGQVTYDEAHGYPLEYIQSSLSVVDEINLAADAADELEFTPMMRVQFSDYVDVTETGAVSAVGTDNGEAEYYNLNGIRVDGKVPGLYIKRQGNKTTKVLVTK